MHLMEKLFKMAIYPEALENLIIALNALPGIGKRSAERIALYLLDSKDNTALNLSNHIKEVKEKIISCPVCNNFAMDTLCGICSEGRRDKTQVCIVEYPKDVIALEKTGIFKGVYYVLLGSISPIDGRGPQSLDLSKLIKRVNDGEINEIIIATDADQEGESTALFIKNLLSQYDVNITRIGIGVPLGSQIEFTDPATLAKSFSERKTLL